MPGRNVEYLVFAEAVAMLGVIHRQFGRRLHSFCWALRCSAFLQDAASRQHKHSTFHACGPLCAALFTSFLISLFRCPAGTGFTSVQGWQLPPRAESTTVFVRQGKTTSAVLSNLPPRHSARLLACVSCRTIVDDSAPFLALRNLAQGLAPVLLHSHVTGGRSRPAYHPSAKKFSAPRPGRCSCTSAASYRS